MWVNCPKCPISSVDRALRYGRRGQGFEYLMGYVEVAQESRLAQHVSAVKEKSGGAVNLVSSVGWHTTSHHQVVIAQTVERRPHMADVGGSIPPDGTVNEAKAVAATGCDPVPSGFKSRRSPHVDVDSIGSCVLHCPHCWHR